MPQVFLGLGSNIEPRANLGLALRELGRRFGELRLSPVYRSRASGFDGPDFLNLVVALETERSAAELSREIAAIHALAGRDRNCGRHVSRTLDIDLLMYGALVSGPESQGLPREDILEYDFVLRPLAELAPDLLHPVTGRRVAEHWRQFDGATHDLVAVDDIL